MNISIIYWSGTGNTQAMAELIAEGAREAGAQVTVKEVYSASVEDFASADAAALGCPSMGDESLDDDFAAYVDSLADKVSGKKLGLFGSYDWGDGQWMRDWVARMNDAGAVVAGEGIIVNLTPEGDSAEACKEYGKALASM
ncbi:flavodoxin [Oscillospiraceae bacterium MB08-C2-2]|nr:flavodoxin [Oscillospiraceae bacterium MB08-C2-2]